MMALQTTSLASVCEISMGQAPNGTSYNFDGNGYPLIAGAGDFGETTPSPGKWTDSPTKLSGIGDIILCIRATIGDLNWADKVYCLGRGVAGLSANAENLDQDYLWHWLSFSAGDLKAKGRGATFLQVSKADIASLQIPLPPLAEQKRIAAILDAADTLRAKRRESLTQLDTLLQSTFLDMFGDPVTNPKGWEVVELASLIEADDKINYGVVQPGNDHPSGKPLIRVSDFSSGELDTSDLKYIDPDIEKKYRRSRLTGREILISCVTAGVIGTVCKAPCEVKGFNIARAVARIPLKEDVDRDFMLYCLRTKAVRRYFVKETRAVAQPTLNIGLIKTAPVLLPPLDIQRRFATIVESVEQQKIRLRKHLAELDTLFASLQSRAFNGEL